MSKIQHILRVIVAAYICLLPTQLMAQNDGVGAPKRNAMDDLFLDPEPWSGGHFAQHRDLLDRLYFNGSVGIGSLWEYDNIADNSSRGYNYHLGLGYKFSPVHAVEFGTSYKEMDLLGGYWGMDLSYLFDVTSYASRLEEPGRWQVLLKSGVGVDFPHDRSAAIALNGAMRVQYNVNSAVGVYVEPMLSYYCSPNYSSTARGGSVYTSAMLGVSFNIGRVVDSYRERRERILGGDYESVPFFAIKTNLLFDAISLINIELEVPIRDKWSIAADYTFPWWTWDDGTSQSRRNRIQLLQGNIMGRYWLGNRAQQPQLTGWFVGLYAGAGLYDFEHRGDGVQGELFIAGGVAGGYAHTINKSGNLRMEYSLGVGYMQTDYRRYTAEYYGENDWRAVRTSNGSYSWFGPTQAKVSLAWMLNHKIKKGGVR